jgi:DNA-binding GntR family transcriptional regulator
VIHSTKTQKTALYSHLKNAILTLDLPAGQTLDEAALGHMFSLLNAPLHEVYRQLAFEGYLDLSDPQAPRVTEISHNTLRDFFISAPMIYGAILRLATTNRTHTQLNRLKIAQQAFKATLRSGTAAERTLSNHRFHEITGEMANSKYLLPAFNRLLIDQARISMAFYQPKSAAMATALQEADHQHDDIITALQQRNAKAAEQLAIDHWNLSRPQIEGCVMPSPQDMPLQATTLRAAI